MSIFARSLPTLRVALEDHRYLPRECPWNASFDLAWREGGGERYYANNSSLIREYIGRVCIMRDG